MRNALEGETAVKGAGINYLPMPGGFRIQDDLGVAMYRDYAIQHRDVIARFGRFPGS